MYCLSLPNYYCKDVNINLVHPGDRHNIIHFLLFQNLDMIAQETNLEHHDLGLHTATKKNYAHSMNKPDFKLTSNVTFGECRRCPEN
jgi:hypothetical protein